MSASEATLLSYCHLFLSINIHRADARFALTITIVYFANDQITLEYQYMKERALYITVSKFITKNQALKQMMRKFIDTQNSFFCVPISETRCNTQTNFAVFTPVRALLPYLVFPALNSSFEWSFFFSIDGQYSGKCLPISRNDFTESRVGLRVVSGFSSYT